MFSGLTRTRAAAVSLLAAVPLALGLAACGGQADPAAQSAPESGRMKVTQSTPVTVGLTYIPNVQFAPTYVAEDEGLFADAGLQATIRHHGGDEGLFTALAAGEENVVLATGDELLQANDQGLDLVSIGSYYHHYPVVVIANESSGINSVADLKGKKVGVPGEYGSSWFALLAALKSAGLSQSDVEVVSIGYTSQSALAQGEVDAVMGFENNDLVRIQEGGAKVKSIPIMSDGSEPPLIPVAIITTHQWAEANPEAAKEVVAAITQATQAIIDDPQKAIDSTKTRDETLTDDAALAGAQKVLDATIPLWKGADGKATARQDPAQWEAMATFLKSVPGLINGEPDVAKAVTNEYVGS